MAEPQEEQEQNAMDCFRVLLAALGFGPPLAADDANSEGEELDVLELDPNSLVLQLVSGTHCMQGKRPSMEDAHIMLDQYELDDQFPAPSFYGIYDGHRGSRAAEWAAEHVHNTIREQLVARLKENSDEDEASESVKENCRPIKQIVADELSSYQDSEGVKQALIEAFLVADATFLNIAREHGWNDGSTAVAALFLGKRLYAANCGDAEMLVGQLADGPNGSVKPVCLTHLHKPSDKEERARIMKAGGMVLGGRVAGQLGVARAFGDLEFKTPIKEAGMEIGELITALPFVSSVLLTPKDKFVLLGCDGIWESLSHEESLACVAKSMREGATPDKAAQDVCQHAINMGSTDNVSATVLYLKWRRA